MTRHMVPHGTAGLPNTDPFPETAKEPARRLGLYDWITVLTESTTSSAGVTKETFTPSSVVRGRIDPVGTRGFAITMGDVISEATTHLLTVDQTVTLSTKDRVKVQGKTWIITGARQGSDNLHNQYEIKAL